jgi:hypothetical protein
MNFVACNIMNFDAVEFGWYVGTFRRNLLPPFARQNSGNILQDVHNCLLKRMASQIFYISDRGLFGLIITDSYYFCKRRQGHLQSVQILTFYVHSDVPGTLVNILEYKNSNLLECYSMSASAESSWNVMAHGDAREGKWRENWRMEWVDSTLHTNSEHGVSSITTADMHTSAASSRLNWRAPADLYGLVRFAGRWNLVSAHVPSHFKRSPPDFLTFKTKTPSLFTSRHGVIYQKNLTFRNAAVRA